MKSVPVEAAVGMVLCHDITRIVPGSFKGRAFKKGHVLNEQDIPVLLDMGKRNIYVWDLEEGYVHEDDAALRIATAAMGDGIELTAPSEGRVNLIACRDGLLKIDVQTLFRVNDIENIVFPTIHSNQPVKAGQALGGTRIIPLVIEQDKLRTVEEVCRQNKPMIQVKPFHPFEVGIITTGSEIYHGRIEDKFGPVLREKFSEFGSRIIKQVFVSDDKDMTVKAIHEFAADGAQLIVLTGGMSVDPDDQTPASIAAAGGRIVTYGAPTFPGAMFMMAYLNGIPVLGLPGSVMYYRSTIFDLIVPRILAGETIHRKDIVSLGHGGYCAGCQECRYPVCPFGKGT